MFCGAVALGSPIIRVIEVSPRDVRGRFVALPLDFGLPRITQNICKMFICSLPRGRSVLSA